MAYIENRTVHDADSHVMEMPDKILEYLEPRLSVEIFPIDFYWFVLGHERSKKKGKLKMVDFYYM